MERSNLLVGVVLGISAIIAAAVFGTFLYESRKVRDTVSVVGIATERYEADIVKWKIRLEEATPLNDLKSGYAKLKKSVENLTAVLLQKDIKKESITINPVNTYPVYDRDGVVNGYRVQQNLYVIAENIQSIEGLALNPDELINKEVFIHESNLEYFYSDVDRLKVQLLSHATANAKERAMEMLKNTDLKPDKLVSLRAGVFQITEPYSTDVASYGVYNTSSRKKEIKVTVHAVFTIK